MSIYLTSLSAIVERDFLGFLNQRGRLVSALVRPLVWLFVFAAGFRAALGLSISPPYETYINYEDYIVPGLCGMILLFNGMQSSLSLVYDREMGSMRILLISPLPRWWILFSKIIASTIVSMLQVYIFLLIAYFYGITFDLTGYITVAPALLLGGMMLGALGLVLSSLIKQLENFAGVMNFVIFPMFFLSSALYPLWKMAESSELLYTICSINPFTYAVELIRFSLFVQLELSSAIIVFACSIAFLMIAIWGTIHKRVLFNARLKRNFVVPCGHETYPSPFVDPIVASLW